MLKYSWKEFDVDCQIIKEWIEHQNIEFEEIYGIPKGGLPLAVKLCNLLNIPLLTHPQHVSKSTLVVDDISDSGKTLKVFKMMGCKIVTIFFHKQTITLPDFFIREKKDEWIVFPWEE